MMDKYAQMRHVIWFRTPFNVEKMRANEGCDLGLGPLQCGKNEEKWSMRPPLRTRFNARTMRTNELCDLGLGAVSV